MSLRAANAQPPGVSAFAARKQTAQTTNDVPKHLDLASPDGGDEYNGLDTAKRRKKAPIPAVNEYAGAQWRRSKKRKTHTDVGIRLELSRQSQASEGPSVETPQVGLAVKTQDKVASTGTLATPGSTDIVSVDSQGQRHFNDEYRIHYRKCSPNNPGDDRDEVELNDAERQSDKKDLGRRRLVPDDSAPPAQSVRQLSTFVPSKNSVIDQSGSEWTISLEEGDTVTLVGAYDIWVQKGAISILGAILHQSSITHRVYAPSIHSLPSMKSIRNPFGPAKQRAVVTVSSCNSGIRSLRQVSSKFGRIWNYNTQVPDRQTLFLGDMRRRTFQNLNVDTDDAYQRPLHHLTIPTDWQSLISTLTSQPQPNQPKSMLVCGPKGSGKSTFSRILANTILTNPSLISNLDNITKATGCVALLDIDPGQPEFSPPGEVSLLKLNYCNFGPPFTHPVAITKRVELIRSHHIAAATPSGDPRHYLECVLNLFLHYRHLLSRYPFCPLIVNTTGWIQGSGLELLSDLIRHISPTNVIYTSVQGPPEVIETIAQTVDQSKTKLHLVKSQPSDIMARNSTELRLMQTLSYFHIDEPENDNIRWNAKPVTEMTPLSVHYAGPNQSIYGVLLLGHELDPELLGQVLEGSIVGLVVVDDDAALQTLLKVRDETDDELSNHGGDQIVSSSPTQHEDLSCESIDRKADSNPSLPQDIDDPFLHSNVDPTGSQRSSGYNQTPLLPRTTSHIPYVRSARNFAPSPSPSQTHSLGQALIHSVDSTNHILNVITPIPLSTLNALHQQQKKILLVRGTLETPTWAYKEDMYRQIHRRKRIRKESVREGNVEAWGKDDTRWWAAGRPWTRPEGRAKGERVRRLRRDLGRKKVEQRE
ncbi:MAG: hypothetical protein Q9216_004989 [Gyalolechia sp. 2 TL-2023]